jgi:hypothetical protein
MLAAAMLAVAGGCGGASSGPASSGPTAAPSTASTTTPTGPAIKNLVVTTAVRAQLLAAGAALHHLPLKDYTGLVQGETYYAYDAATTTYWAGAALIASPTSVKAQVGNQDDGAYLDFTRPAGGSWSAYDAGLPGSSSYTCAVTIPAGVVAAWGWAAGTCHPNH